MAWAISEQATKAYQTAALNDEPIQQAMDRLWVRLDLDPLHEGIPLDEAADSTDPNLRRVLKAIAALFLPSRQHDPNRPQPRISYEPIDGPALPPSWLVFSLHVPDWVPPRRTEDHTLIALGTVDRGGKARS